MPCFKMLCSAMVFMLVVLVGCGKNDKQNAMKKTADLPMIGKKSADTSDVFKEFYSDDTAGQGTPKKSSKKASSKGQTFSPASSVSAASGEFSENGRYVVQVSCVPSKAFAEKMVAALKEKNFPAYAATVQNPTPKLSGTYYRVRIGGFGGISAAKSFGENSLVASGYEYWVDKKSNDNVGMEGYGLGGSPSANSPASSYENGSTPSSWSSSPAGTETSTETSKASAGGAVPSPAAVPETPSAPPSVPVAPASNVPTPEKNPAPTQAPTGAPSSPAAVSPAASETQTQSKNETPAPGKKTTGPGDWGSDSSSSSGGW
jgi:hypothetical protein